MPDDEYKAPKLTNKDIADLKFALENTNEEPYSDHDIVTIRLATGGAYRLNCVLNSLAPKIVAYFTEQSRCNDCAGTGMRKL